MDHRVKNKPSLINGEIKDAPATLIVVDKGMDGSMPFGFIFILSIWDPM